MTAEDLISKSEELNEDIEHTFNPDLEARLRYLATDIDLGSFGYEFRYIEYGKVKWCVRLLKPQTGVK